MKEKIVFNDMSEFLKWNFLNPASDRVAKAFKLYYSRYVSDPNNMEYVWEHYNSRSVKLVEQSKLGKKIIEVGCGIGMNSMFAALNGGKVVGVEVKDFDTEVAKEQLAHIKKTFDVEIDCTFFCGDATKLNLEGPFDVIFMQEAFHHIEPRNKFVNWLKSKTSQNGGMIIFQESNALNPLVQAFLFKVRGFETVKTKTDPDTGLEYTYGNERIITSSSLATLFKLDGYQVEPVRYFRVLPTSLSKITILRYLAKIIESNSIIRSLFYFIFLHYELVLTRQLKINR